MVKYNKLVDQFGNPVSSGFFKSTRRDSEIPLDMQRAKPFGISGLSFEDHLKLIGQSRNLYSNNGMYKAISEFMATWSIQNSFQFVYKGKDIVYGNEINEWLDNNFLNSVNLTKDHSFKTQLYLDCLSIDRDGDVFTILTRDKDGNPKLVSYPSFAVHNGKDSDVVTSGRYKGAKINKGIITDRLGRIVAYRFCTDEKYSDVPKEYVLHLYDNLFLEQNRGLPSLSFGLKSFAQIDQSISFEMLAQMINSSYALVEQNESGGYEEEDSTSSMFGSASNYTSESSPSTVHDLNGGQIKFFKAGTNSKLEAINNNRPSPQYNEFHDRLMKSICAGMGISYSLIFENSLASVTMRGQLRRTEISIKDRQVLLKEYSKRILNFAISCGIDKGEISPNKEFIKFDLTLPAPLSTDILRDGNNVRADLEAGILNMEDVLDSHGKKPNVEEHYRIRANEVAMKKVAAENASKEFGVSVLPEEL